MAEETFLRPPEVEREPRHLPAQTYNLSRLLLARCGLECLFVPIRSMQYLAVLDHEEIIFVDREYRHLIEISWQDFQPEERSALTEPVSFIAVYYSPAAKQTMRRLQGEFHRALQQLESKMPVPGGPARILKINSDDS